MKDLAEWNAESDPYFDRRRIIAFDLDDTLTEHGQLPSEIHAALESAQKKNWITILVTGRPAGWADALIKLLPFDAIVAENGALLFYWPQLKGNRKTFEETSKLFWTVAGYQKAPRGDLKSFHAKASAQILSSVPRSRVASDQPYRLYDLAIDFAEEVDPPLSLSEAEKIRDIFVSLGATAKVSSIHVNGWWGTFSKESALRELVEKIWSYSLKEDVVYVGDSPNDGPLFAAAGVSIGVANVRAFEKQKGFHLPTYICQGKSSAGSLEIFNRLNPRP